MTINDNGNIRTIHSNNNPMGPRNNNNAPRGAMGNNMDPFQAFNHPFFSQNMGGMSGFNHPFFTNNNHNRNNNNGPQQPQMINMNILNNMMMGGMGGIPMGGNDGGFMFQFLPQRPPVANQETVDALPTDTFKTKPKKSKNNENSNNKAKEEKEEPNNDMDMKNNDKCNDDEDDNKPESCSICLETFKDGDEIRRLPCLHIFHKNEIDRWLLTGADKCPICRIPINGRRANAIPQ